jgi:antitoxin (DNA-binding transcriptional repressor) of toxin-antitoxin stability system
VRKRSSERIAALPRANGGETTSVKCTTVYNTGMDLNISEARRQLLTLVEDLPKEGVTLMKHGKPVARLVPVDPPRKGRFVTVPLLEGKGEPGPLCPTIENPYDLVLP